MAEYEIGYLSNSFGLKAYSANDLLWCTINKV